MTSSVVKNIGNANVENLQITKPIVGTTGRVQSHDNASAWDSDLACVTKCMTSPSSTNGFNALIPHPLNFPIAFEAAYAWDIEWLGIITNVTGGAGTGLTINLTFPFGVSGSYLYEFGSSAGSISFMRGQITTSSTPSFTLLAGAAAGSTTSFRINLVIYDLTGSLSGTILLNPRTNSTGGTWLMTNGAKIVARRSLLA